MYTKAIEKSMKYTKPLISGELTYRKKNIINNINTLIVLNDEGDILTCAHVADRFRRSDEINEIYKPILEEMKDVSARNIKKTEIKYGINDNDIINMHNVIIDVGNNLGKLNIIMHPVLDIAIIKMEKMKDIYVDEFPIFAKKNPLIGQNVCKIGFAFPEYDVFYYDDKTNQIKTHNRLMNFPLFPLDGMITRNMIDQDGNITMFEISTPSLPGQAGGPVLNEKGEICGLLAGTKRISSNYANEMPFNLDLGLAYNITSITNFLDEHNIKYNKSAK